VIGLKQRELIHDILKRSEGHLDAGEIYQRARQRSPSITLSTVYRNLHLFRKPALVEQHQSCLASYCPDCQQRLSINNSHATVSGLKEVR